MILKHKDIEIPGEEPFKNCKLDRLRHAKALTSVVATYAEGFVLSLNNPWGAGKTTFIKMWRALLDAEGFRTLHFNAWENDFDADPMVALMSELGTLTGTKSDKKFNSLIRKAATLSHSVVPGLLKALAAKYIDKQVLVDVIGDASKGASDLLKDEIFTYTKKKQGLVDFKEELTAYISAQTEEKPLVFFIDELDRCRPNYAVELLEQLKHFFSVPGIVFVLSIDKLQLGNAIRGFYGSERINSEEYLRRFIDLEFSLPNPTPDIFVEYLYEYFNFGEFFKNEERKRYEQLRYDREEFIKFATLLFSANNMTLRQQEKLFAHARVAIRSFEVRSYVFPGVFVLLVYVKEFEAELYHQLMARKFSPQQVLDEFSKHLTSPSHQKSEHIHIVIEATLLKLYQNYYREIYHESKITERGENFVTKLLIEPYSDRSAGKTTFKNMLEHFNSSNGGDAKLSHLFDKINFMDTLKVL